MRLLNDQPAIILPFQDCPITGEPADYAFAMTYGLDGYEYRLPTLNPGVILTITGMVIRDGRYLQLVGHGALVANWIAASAKERLYIDSIFIRNHT